jgi:hypothetical protein
MSVTVIKTVSSTCHAKVKSSREVASHIDSPRMKARPERRRLICDPQRERRDDPTLH